MPKSFSVAITVEKVAFWRSCWRFAMRRPGFLSAAFIGGSFSGAHISGFTRATVAFKQFSGSSVLAHRLFAISASCFVTLGHFFSSSMRPALSYVRLGVSCSSRFATVQQKLIPVFFWCSDSVCIRLLNFCADVRILAQSDEDTLWHYTGVF